MVVVVAAGGDGKLTEFHHYDSDFFTVNSKGILVVGNRFGERDTLYDDWTSVRYRNGKGAIEAYRTPPLRIEKL